MNRIKELRRTKGISQDELAHVLGVTQQTVAKWESGRTYPRARQIPAIASALNCSINDLFSANNDATNKAPSS